MARARGGQLDERLLPRVGLAAPASHARPVLAQFQATAWTSGVASQVNAGDDLAFRFLSSYRHLYSAMGLTRPTGRC